MGKFDGRRAVTHGLKQGLVVTEVTSIELDRDDYVAIMATGEQAAGEYHCSECGYGVSVQNVLPRCPMCGGTSWEQSSGRPVRHELLQ